MYCKVIKEGVKYTSPVGYKQAAPKGAVINIENLFEYEQLMKEKSIEKYDVFQSKGVMTSKTLGPDIPETPKEANTEGLEFKKGDVVIARYEDDDEEEREGSGDILTIQKNGDVRIDFQEEDQKFRIVSPDNILKVVS